MHAAGVVFWVEMAFFFFKTNHQNRTIGINIPAAKQTSANLLAVNMPLNTSTALSRVPQWGDIMPYWPSLYFLHLLRQQGSPWQHNKILNLRSLPTMLIGSRSWGNGVAPEDSWGKKAAKVRARTAGRTGRGEPGVSLILAEDETSPETHGPQQIHLPPGMTRKVIRVRTVSISEPPLCLNNHTVNTHCESFYCITYIGLVYQVKKLQQLCDWTKTAAIFKGGS